MFYDIYMIIVSTKCSHNGDVILWCHNDVISGKSHHFQKPSDFGVYQCNFQFLLQFLFVWHMYYTFCSVISLIYWFLNRFFSWNLVDQNFGKPKFWQNFVIWTYIQASDFCCFNVSYCKPMLIIDFKFLFASDDCTITA